jgi:hypothetical protein
LNFKRSFNPKVPLRPEGCSWRWHLPPGVLREVMTYMDLLAKQHPMRYVYAKPADIVAHTKDYAKPGTPPFTVRAVFLALAYLRAIKFLIQSPWERSGRRVEYGHFVLAHDDSCRPEGNHCLCFMFDPELPELVYKPPRKPRKRKP